MSERHTVSQENPHDSGQPQSARGGLHEARVREYQEHIADIYSIADEEDAARRKIQEIGQKLEGDGPHKGKITYKLIHNSSENAFACGTTVYIYSGLLVALKTESEVAGVIAHELSHIEHGDTMKINDARRTFWEEISRGRIQEYLADSVLHKMHQGGYHPAAYERVLQYLAYGQNSVGFTHGASSDRQAAYRAQLHVFDLETTAKPDTSVRPPEFSPETLKPLQQASSFDSIRARVKSGKIETIAPSVESLNTTSLLILWSEEVTWAEALFSKMSWRSYKRFNNSRERAEHMRQLKDHALLLHVLNETLARRIDGSLPTLPTNAQTWLRVMLLSDSQGFKSDTFEEIMRFAEMKTKVPMPKFRTELMRSVTSTDNIQELARFTKTYDQSASALGVAVDTSVHSETIFKTVTSNQYMPKESDSFFRTALKRALKSEGIEDPLDTLVGIGESLSVFAGNKASGPWFLSECEAGFKLYIESMLSRTPVKRQKGSKDKSSSDTLDKLQAAASQAVVRYGAVLTRAGFSGAEPYLLGIMKTQLSSFFAKAKVGYREVNTFELGLASAVAEAKRGQDELFRSFSLAASLTPDAQRAYLHTLRFSDLLHIRTMANFDEVCPDPSVRKTFKENIVAFLLDEYKLSAEDYGRIRLLAERRGFIPRASVVESDVDGETENDDAAVLARFGITQETCRLLATLQFETMFGSGDRLSDKVLNKLNTVWNS